METLNALRFTNKCWGLLKSGDQWSSDLCLISGPSGSLNPPCDYSSVPECIIGMNILSRWQNSHIGSLTCGKKKKSQV